LQWHLTNRCSFQCRHCYDRTPRAELSAAEVDQVFGDLLLFCGRRGVQPRLSLTGGDPLLHPSFWALYTAAASARVGTSLLGNPVEAPVIERLLAIRPPAFYQVSLEGLEDHNDHVRGRGHFARTLAFLRDARAHGLRTVVMLTLTRDNIDQVIPLGARLSGLTSRVTFNRLSQVGEAADLAVPTREAFASFLRAYVQARRENPIFGLKENLFSLLREETGGKAARGCTGHGCGAAFNFLAVLPDGEVHACRKFPSRVGHVLHASLEEIYGSAAARAYRTGSSACRHCRLRPACGGCLAAAYGAGLDPLRDRDPHCWRE
jgi:selenobiotic family peptide radical SAM maturase